MLVGLLGCRQLDLDFSSKLRKSHQKIKKCQESFLEDSNRVTKHRVWIIVYVHNWIISFGTNFDLLMTTPRRNAQRVARSTWQTLPPSGKPETHQIEIFRLTIFIIRRRKSRVICLLLRLVFWQIRGTRTNLKSRKKRFWPSTNVCFWVPSIPTISTPPSKVCSSMSPRILAPTSWSLKMTLTWVYKQSQTIKT